MSYQEQQQQQQKQKQRIHASPLHRHQWRPPSASTLLQDKDDFNHLEPSEQTPLLHEQASNAGTYGSGSLRHSNPSGYRLRADPSTAAGLPDHHVHVGTSAASIKVPWWRDVFKATAAFMLACSLTFVTPLRQYMGYSSQLAAVAVLTFHPCKSYGALFESTIIGLLGVLFGSVVSLLGLYAVVAFQHFGPNNPWMILSLLGLIFTTTFWLAYVRARSMRATVYTGTIMALIIISTILTNVQNHRLQKLDPMMMVNTIWPTVAGIMVSMLSNWIIWPVSATTVLRAEIARMLYSFEDLIQLFTSTFLLTRPESETGHRVRIESAMSIHHMHALYLSRANDEAKLEFLSRILSSAHTRNDQTIVESMNRLTQHVGGMKSSIVKEDDMLKRRRLSSANIEFLREFLEHIGPAVSELGQRCRHAVQEVNMVVSMKAQSRFWKPVRTYNQCIKAANHLHQVQLELRSALDQFTQSQQAMLMSLYENEKFDGKPNDELFLVYFFVFCMMEFAKELDQGLVESVKQIKVREAGSKPWGWFWCCFGWPELVENHTESVTASQQPRKSRRPTANMQPAAQEPNNGESSDKERYFQFLQSQTNSAYHRYLKTPSRKTSAATAMPDLDAAHTSGTGADDLPVHISSFLRQRLRLWRFLSNIGHSFELKYAFKMACVITGFASMAFIPQTEALYQEFYGHWAILSTVVTMSPTVGGTNMAGLYRILGTIVGAGYSYLIWWLFPYDPIGLMCMIALFAAPCFYLFLYSQYPRLAQVMLLTVCAIVVANYANKDNPGWTFTIWDLAWKRALVVIAGIVAGLLVTWYVWPYEARVELRRGLSDLLINMGILYSRLVEVFNHGDATSGPSTTLPRGLNKITPSTIHNFFYKDFDSMSTQATLAYFLSFELKLQQSLMFLTQLMPLTRLEPRLKGPFPVEVYNDMLQCCQNILDKFVAMRVAIANNVENDSSDLSDDDTQSEINGHRIREDLILGITPIPVSAPSSPIVAAKKETLPQHPDLLPLRRELVGSVLLCFYVFAGALILKQPLPTYLPPARAAKKRLLEKMHAVIAQAQKSEQDKQSTWRRLKTGQPTPGHIRDPARYINYYAYALSLEDVIVELEHLGVILKNLFGEMFADVVQYEDEVVLDVTGAEEVDVEETKLKVRHVPVVIHHHRADQWGSRRLHELEGRESVASGPRAIPPRRPQRLQSLLPSEQPPNRRTNGMSASLPQVRPVDMQAALLEPSESATTPSHSPDRVAMWRSSGAWMV